METLQHYYFKKANKSPYLWKNQVGIEKGINYFRHNVIEEFIRLNCYNIIESFELFSEKTYFWEIYTKEDFKYFLFDFYDEIGECNYFNYLYSYDEPNSYRQYILDLWGDGVYSYSDVKRILKEWNKSDDYHIDGTLDYMLHAQADTIDFLPSERAMKHYDKRKMKLIKRENVLNYLKNINNKRND